MLFQLFFIIQENKGIICYVHVLSTQVGILHGHQHICIYGWGKVGNACVFLKAGFLAIHRSAESLVGSLKVPPELQEGVIGLLCEEEQCGFSGFSHTKDLKID
jgi:hypothetical protein